MKAARKHELLRITHTVIKMGLAGLITSVITLLLDLNWLTAGILAVLSTQLTKKDSFIIAGRRMLDTVLGLLLSFGLFALFGQEPWVFILIIFVFAFLSFILKIPEGIVPVLVLISHVLIADELTFKLFLDEFLIMFIAVVVVLALDLIYPQRKDHEFLVYAKSIDRLIREHILVIANYLKEDITKEEAMEHHEYIVKVTEETFEQVRLLDKDILFSKSGTYSGYLQMRKEQIKHINHIYMHSLKIVEKHEYIYKIITFLEELSFDIGLVDKASEQLVKLQEFRDSFKIKSLPETRNEFETRAMLYQMINEIEYLLNVKIKFHKENPNFYISYDKNKEENENTDISWFL